MSIKFETKTLFLQNLQKNAMSRNPKLPFFHEFEEKAHKSNFTDNHYMKAHQYMVPKMSNS